MASTTLLSDNGVTSGITGYQLTGGDDGTLQLQTTTAGGAAATAMTINNSQNVGIGTSSPTTKLVVNNDTDNSTMAIFHAGGGTPNRGLKVSTFVSTNDNAGVLLDAQTTAGGAALAFGTAGTERARIDSSGNLKFNSGFGSVATAYGCRAWVNFNGTGTVAIHASGNVSSITDNGTGDYTVNYTTGMPDTSYVGAGSGQADTSNADANRITVSARRISGAYATGSTRIVTGFSSSGSGTDPVVANWAIFR